MTVYRIRKRKGPTAMYTFNFELAGHPTSMTEHAQHHGQSCELVRESLDVDEEVEPLFIVRFADGEELHAYQSELTPRPASSRVPIVESGEVVGWTVP